MHDPWESICQELSLCSFQAEDRDAPRHIEKGGGANRADDGIHPFMGKQYINYTITH